MKDSQVTKNKTQKSKSAKTFFFKARSLIILALLFLFNLVLIYSIFILLEKIQGNSFTDYSAYRATTRNFPSFNKNVVLNVSSPSYIVYDPDERVVVLGQNKNFKFPPASSAKIMTATIALESYSPYKALTAVGPQFVIGSRMGLVDGENIRVKDLLYGLLLPSGNDAALTLAENYPGGVSAFVARMNEKSQELGLKDTYFLDPAGLEDSNLTTAQDLARLASYAMKNPTFKKIVNTKEATVIPTNLDITHVLSNLNELLGKDGVNGVKTGFTEEAGGVLVTSLLQGDKNYIIVVLKSLDRFSDTRELINKVVKNIELIDL